MSGPSSPAYDAVNSRLFVGDYGNNRVLVYNVAPGTIANGENASYELGQPSGTAFTSATAADTQAGMHNPYDVAYDATNSRLFVSDVTNNRVLVYNVATGSIANGENASNVLGQSSWTSGGAATTQAGMDYPIGLEYDATNSRLFVADYYNNRMLVYNVAPGTIANGENASYVLGQANFTSGSANKGGSEGQATLSYPSSAAYDAVNNRLFVADWTNNRVLEFLVPSGHGNEGDLMYNSNYNVYQYCNGTEWMKIRSHSH
jgi:DNA-binding beta-propeller fold protein YncE